MRWPNVAVCLILTFAFLRLAQAQDDTFADLQPILEALNPALEAAPSGAPTSWHNPTTGHHGVIIALPPATDHQGQLCREYKRTWVRRAVTSTFRGTACRQPNCVWKIRWEGQIANVDEPPPVSLRTVH
jgi:hypothetical protein